jgi:hypothetical protein
LQFSGFRDNSPNQQSASYGRRFVSAGHFPPTLREQSRKQGLCAAIGEALMYALFVCISFFTHSADNYCQPIDPTIFSNVAQCQDFRTRAKLNRAYTEASFTREFVCMSKPTWSPAE